MNEQTAIGLKQERGTLTEEAGLDTGPVPLDPYRSQAHFELERERIFRRAWLMVGRVEEVAEKGDFFQARIDPCGVSVLVTHDRSGAIQAFHNSCAHRGSQVVSQRKGRANRFICPYHRWSYGSDGRLLGMTDEANFFDVDKAKCGLKPVATQLWEGWIFINLAPEPEVSLDEFLGDFKQYFAGVSYQGASHPVIFEADLDANWKVVADAFIETYHIPHIHPETIGTTFSSNRNPFCRLLSAKLMGPHCQVSMFGNSEFELDGEARVQAIAAKAMPAGSLIAAAPREGAVNFLDHPAINPGRSPDWSMDVNYIFPHTHIDCGPGGFWTHQFWPTSPNTSRYEGRFYMNPAASMAERFLQELYVGRVAEVVLEDLFNVGRTQAGIDTGGQSEMQLQDSEVGIRHNLENTMKWTRSATVREALS